MKINRLLTLWILWIWILLSGCGTSNVQNIENKKNQEVVAIKPGRMQWQTNEAITEHCQMMPSMEWCNTINK